MAKGYTMTLTQPTEENFRNERAKIVTKMYLEQMEQNPQTSRHVLMQNMSMELGITTKCIKDILRSAGLPTALPNYENSGVRSTDNSN